MGNRRIAVTPGSGDFVGVVDTEALDASGNAISAQASVVMNERGEVLDINQVMAELLDATRTTNKLLLLILNKPNLGRKGV